MSHLWNACQQAPRKFLIAIGLVSVVLSGCDEESKVGYAPASSEAREEMMLMNSTDQEDYQHYQENPFLEVSAEALSTFSSSVDTASYTNCRSKLNTGTLPPKDAVRIADFVNYFQYQYEGPKDNKPVRFHLEVAKCPWQSKHLLLRIGVQAKKIDPAELPARNLVFLIDTSGSMSEHNKLPLVINSLELLVNQLTAKDRVAIVTYAGNAGVVLPPTSGAEKDRIGQALQRLKAGGSTNGEGGIREAYSLAQQNYSPTSLNRVILATDGDFNVGITDRSQLVRLLEEKRKTGIYLTCLGYGMGNLKDTTLEQMSHHGNGFYAYIDNINEAKKVFVDQGGALVTVAKDVKLQVEFNPAHIAGYRLIGYENRLLRAEDFRNDAKDAGDMGSGHTCTALYELVPAGLTVPASKSPELKYQDKPKLSKSGLTNEMLTMRMRYKDPVSDAAQEIETSVKANQIEAAPSADFHCAAAAAGFGMLLRKSEFAGTADYDSVIAWATKSIVYDPGQHRSELIQLATIAKGLASKEEKLPPGK
ncbi:MAG: VWA domain-containing protein [Zavarzinella sp.]